MGCEESQTTTTPTTTDDNNTDDDNSDDDTPTPTTFTLTSNDLTEGENIPSTFALSAAEGCTLANAGSNASPHLDWSTQTPSENVNTFAITMRDLDFNASGGEPFVHWVVYNIPSTVTSLSQGAATNLPTGAANGPTDFDPPITAGGYGGPCPTAGSASHTYEFKVWALTIDDLTRDTSVNVNSLSSLLAGIETHNASISGGTASFTREFSR